MRYSCRPVDIDFFESAPLRFVHSVEIAASANRIFAHFEDEHAWPRWWRGMREVLWTSPRPFGVGTTRTVRFDAGSLAEYFFRWESGRRFSFYLTGQSVPLFRALAEDYLLETIAPGRARFTYSVAIDPGLLLRLGGALSRRILDGMFGRATAALPAFIDSQPLA